MTIDPYFYRGLIMEESEEGAGLGQVHSSQVRKECNGLVWFSLGCEPCPAS